MEHESYSDLGHLTGQNCFTVIVGKGISETGHVIVGHNEDDGWRCVFRYMTVPPGVWKAGETMPAEKEPSPFAPARQDIPQAEKTLGYFWGETVAAEKGKSIGTSGADRFLNERGICLVSNNGGLTADPPLDSGEEGILYILRRAVAERAETPREGVLTAARLIRDYGYKACRIYTIADQDEAWVLQAANGHQFVARRVRDNEVVLIPNFFTIRSVDFSNGHEIESGIMANNEWIWSKGLVQSAIDSGRYHPSAPSDGLFQDFDFAYCYQRHGREPDAYTWNTPASSLRMKHALSMVLGRQWEEDNSAVEEGHPEQGFPFSVKADHDFPDKKIGNRLCRQILRSHFEGTEDDPPEHRMGIPGGNPHEVPNRRICTQTTGESLIIEFAGDPGETTVWLSPGRPCQLPFFPMHLLGAHKFPEKLTAVSDGTAEMERHFYDHPDLLAWHRDDPWWRMRDYENRLDLLYKDFGEEHRQWILEKDRETAADNRKAVIQAGTLKAAEKQKFWEAWDNRQFDVLYQEIQDRCDALPRMVIQISPQIVSKTDMKAVVSIVFQLEGSGVPDPTSLVMGMGMTNSQCFSKEFPLPWQHPVSLYFQEGWWHAVFSARFLVADHPVARPGQFEYYAAGQDEEGHPFCGMVPITIIP
jgi:dipeptidase